MTQPFGSVYANAYDAIYSEKDYAAECRLLQKIFEESSQSPVKTILDLGCGTGNHLLPLLQKGFKVTGVDRSRAMLTRLLEKANGAGVSVAQGDIRSIRLKKKFDAVLMMFAVLGYQIELADVLAALRTAREHLKPQGLLLFDVWYGPAVLYQKPAKRMKFISKPGYKILRIASSQLNIPAQICIVEYELFVLEEDHSFVHLHEKHPMRYFFPAELQLLLSQTGFQLLRIGAFPDLLREPDETCWNVLVSASAF
jgi:SAM-dependent methyltransferase